MVWRSGSAKCDSGVSALLGCLGLKSNSGLKAASVKSCSVHKCEVSEASIEPTVKAVPD